MEGQQQLATILAATLNPDAATRRGAERELLAAQAHPSFGPLVLQLAQDTTAQKSIRQSAALSFKNWIKANWAVSRVPSRAGWFAQWRRAACVQGKRRY
jgi:exportin-2 (importin alpha re-exporter)